MVPPPEDLFREHAVLRRLLNLFDECARITSAGGRYDTRIVVDAAQLFAKFGAGYHAKIEERFIFPIFRHRGYADVVDNLQREHSVATDHVRAIISLGQHGDQSALARAMPEFTWLYRRHTAHEDLALFSHLREVVGSTSKEWRVLCDRMEEFKYKIGGPNAFDDAEATLRSLEMPLGLTTEQIYGS